MKNFSQNKAQNGFPQRKLRGSGLLVMALVGAVVVGVTSLSLAKANSIAINSMGSNKIAMQAQQYVLAKSELVRVTNYFDLVSQGKSNIGNTGFEDEVVVGGEVSVDSTTKKKEVTIRVYKSGEAIPRSSVVVTRYNKSLDSSIPSGTVISWFGNLSSIPSGFVLCDGSNGTPDLRNRFIVGAGASYNLGAIGGVDSVTLTVAQMPSHSHSAWTDSQGSHQHSFGLDNKGSDDPSSSNLNDTGLGGWGGVQAWTSPSGAHSHNVGIGSTGGSQAHENRPPFYALYYIMKL